MNVVGLIGIIVSIVALIFLVYKGLNVVIAAPFATMIIIITSRLGIVEGYRDLYMGGLGGFITSQFPVYLWGSLFGEVYNRSGGATAIARLISRIFKGNKAKASIFASMLIVIIAGVLMSYGGISAIVLMFVLMPMTLEILKENNVPRKMAPGILLAGVATAGLCMPGSPQVQNVIPMNYLGTPATAAMIPGIIGGIVVVCLNLAYLTYSAKKEIARGVVDHDSIDIKKVDDKDLPNPIVSLIPLVVTFVLFNAFHLYVPYAIFAGIICGIILFNKKLFNLGAIKKMLEVSVPQAAFLAFASGSLAGFGAVVGKTEAFGQLSGTLSHLAGPPLLIAMFAFMIITAICGSGPAALGAGLPIFSETFAGMGVNMSALHRVSAFCGTTLDTLPTNAGFIAATGLAKKSPSESYKYVGVCTIINTTIATLVVTALLIFFPGLA